MSECSSQEVKTIYERALRLMLRSSDDPTSDELDLDLLRTKGVLTDCGMWVKPGFAKQLTAPKKNKNTHVEVRRDTFAAEEFVFVVPKTGRYEMSMAQQLLFRMSYGYHVLETATSWQRYEVVIAEYMSVLLYGMQGQKLRDLLQRFGQEEETSANAKTTTSATAKTRTSATAKTATSANAKAAALDKPLSFTRVVTIHTTKQISPKAADGTVSKVYVDCGIASAKATAVVIVNGACAPYADVIVVVPRVAVILIQCKFYDQKSSFDIQREATKLEAEIDELNKRAKVPNGAYFKVLATTKHLQPVGLRGFYLLNTSGETSLAPLFTPIHQPVADGKDAKVARSMDVLHKLQPKLPAKRQRESLWVREDRRQRNEQLPVH